MSTRRHLEVFSKDPPDLLLGLRPEASITEDGATMLVGELARAAGKTVRAIHLYEDLGLLRPQDRSKGRYRLFGAEALVRVRWIAKLQSLGLSLAEIQEVVREQEGADSASFAAARLRHVYLEKLAETRSKLEELHRLERELVESLDYLDACGVRCEPEVPVRGCSTCERHANTAAAPELVVGAQAH